MEMKQIASYLTEVNKEVLGIEDPVLEDLSNVADTGTAIFNSDSYDKYVRTLVDRIGRSVFVNRRYSGRVPSIVVDGWTYGSVMAKYDVDLPDLEENPSWNLTNGTSVDPFVLTLPSVNCRFFNKRVTFECDMSIVELQFRSAFNSATECASFIAMIFNAIENKMTIQMDALIMRAIANMIAETVYSDYGANAITGGSHVKAVNLLYLYNQMVGAGNTITASEMCTTPEFIRFATNIISMYKDRLASYSTLFNVDGRPRFSPKDRQHLVVLSEFDAGSKAYLQSDTYHNEMISIPEGYEVVPYWQGSGTDYGFEDTSKVYVTTNDNHTVTVTGVLAILFDSDAVVATNFDRRVKSMPNGKGEYTNYFYKQDAGYINSLSENFVVFFGASA